MGSSVFDKQVLSQQLRLLAQQAAAAIVEIYYSSQPLVVERKEDQSPVTSADHASHRIIAAGLAVLTPDIPVLSEEANIPPFSERQQWQRYWLVDPLDGTREFIERSDEFTINIALIEKGRATIGLIYLPIGDIVYIGLPEQGFAVRADSYGEHKITVTSQANTETIKILVSRHYQQATLAACTDPLRKHFSEIEAIAAGSALKFCQLAEAGGDIYPRFSPCCEWDTAAGQAIVEAAGGLMVDLNFEPVRYNQKESLLSESFYALGAAGTDWKSLLSLGPN
ncbi:MAG: 3'(2'), 5'-bisphosphate nucleotidase [Pseudohongiellaceae bacterium]